MVLDNEITHLKSYEKIIKNELKNAPNINIRFTKFGSKNESSYVCGKFKKAYISEIESSITGFHERYGLQMNACDDGDCPFCDNRNPAYGSYHAQCRLYNKEINKSLKVFKSSIHDYALCCSECLEDNITEDNFEEDDKLYPYYVQNLKNSIFKDRIDKMSWKDEDFVEYIRTKINTETLEKEIKTILEEIYKSDAESKIKEYENKNVHYISKFIDMYHLSNGDFIVYRITPKHTETMVLINKETDDFIERYLNDLNKK